MNKYNSTRSALTINSSNQAWYTVASTVCGQTQPEPTILATQQVY